MSKNDLVTKVAQKTGLKNQKATKAVNTALETVIQAVAKSGEVRLVGFGTFSRLKRKARNRRNLRIEEPLQIPALTVPQFQDGKEFKEAASGA